MTLTQNSTLTESPTTAAQAPVAELPQQEPGPRPTRNVLSWILVGVVLAALAILVVRVIGTDDEPTESTPTSAQITDAKDQSGYRSPTMTRPLTSGDAKDQPVYRSPTISRPLTSGDAKDQSVYRSPTTTWSLTSGDAKDQPGYRLPTTTWSFTSGDAKDHPGYQLPTATP